MSTARTRSGVPCDDVADLELLVLTKCFVLLLSWLLRDFRFFCADPFKASLVRGLLTDRFIFELSGHFVSSAYPLH